MKLKLPHTFTLVFYLVLIAAVFTWVIPGGEYLRESKMVEGTERMVVVDNSFHYVESQPQTWSVLAAFFEGFVDKADIIVFILIVGGAFWVLNSSRAIDVGIQSFLNFTKTIKLRYLNVDYIIITLVMVLFSLFGAVFGMSEETIAFIIIIVPLAVSMGFDSITGVCISYMAAHVGFAGAMINPFTIGIAQGIAEIPLFSGLEYRFFCWVILTFVSVLFVCLYARYIKKNPRKSPVYAIDDYWRKQSEAQIELEKSSSLALKITYVAVGLIQSAFAFFYPWSVFEIASSSFQTPILPILVILYWIVGWVACKKSMAFYNVLLLFYTIFYLVIGVLAYHWYIMEIATLFFAMGIFSGLSMNKKIDDVFKLFLEGIKDILTPALVVGLASGIIYILEQGRVIDTILYNVSSAMLGVGEIAAVGGMYAFQTLLNVVMPSGSAKAALTMPIMVQFSDLINVSRQTTVLAFQFGDGFTNMITPTSGILLGVLAVARIPYTVWVKWVWKFILFMIILGFLLLLPTLFIPLNGF